MPTDAQPDDLCARCEGAGCLYDPGCSKMVACHCPEGKRWQYADDNDNTPPQPDDLEAEVRELVPCAWPDRCGIDYMGDTSVPGGYVTERCPCCEAQPRVLAALRKQRERQAELEGEVLGLKHGVEDIAKVNRDLERQLAEAKAERDALQRRFDGVSIDRDEQLHIAAEVIAANDELRTRLAHLEAALAKISKLLDRIPAPHDVTLWNEIINMRVECEALAATGGKPE